MSEILEISPVMQSLDADIRDDVTVFMDSIGVDAVQQDIDVRFGYRIGKFGFVLHKNETTEILIDPPIYTIPNSPYWLQGMVNLRSNILPVMDISSVVGNALTSKKGKYVLSIGKASDALALLVDELPCALLQPYETEEIYTPNSALMDFLHPGVLVGTVNWPLLDIKALVRYLKLQENHCVPSAGELIRGD